MKFNSHKKESKKCPTTMRTPEKPCNVVIRSCAPFSEPSVKYYFSVLVLPINDTLLLIEIFKKIIFENLQVFALFLLVGDSQSVNSKMKQNISTKFKSLLYICVL